LTLNSDILSNLLPEASFPHFLNASDRTSPANIKNFMDASKTLATVQKSAPMKAVFAPHALGKQKPEPDGLWFTLSSGERIRTTDLRVMSDFPGFGTFFTQALHFSLT
jgi:hypothetical protein